MRSFRRSARALLAASASLLAFSTSAHGQTATSGTATADNFPEIVVTAQKREEDVQDVPASISVLTDDQIEKLNATQLSDYAAYVPGLQVDSGGTPGQAIVSLRGIAPVGPGQTVGTYIDDTPVGSSSFYARGAEFTLDLLPYDVDRIEVLRGPQGTLYGASSIGGLIKYVTRRPSLDRFELRAGGDLFDQARGGGLGWAGRGAVNVPIVSGTLALTASYGYQHTPGYIDNVATGKRDQNEFDQQAGRATLAWQATPDLYVRLGAIYQEVDSNNNATALVFDDDARTPLGDGFSNNNLVGEPFRKELQYYSGTIEYTLPFATLTSATSYSTMRTKQVQDATESFGALFPIFGEAAGLAPFQLDLKLKKWTEEVRLTSPSGGPFEWLVGLFYTHEDSANAQIVTALANDQTPIAALNPFAVVALPTTYEEYAAFANATLRLGRFKLNAGARYARNEQDFRQQTSGPLFDLGGGRDLPGSSSEGVFTYSFSPQFFVNDDVMLYARVATGYRPGGPNTLLTGAEKPQVDSDRLTNFEFGVKSTLLDQRLIFNLSAFYMDWKDIQVTVECPGVAGCTFLDNAGKAESKGVELSAVLIPARPLRIGFNAAYTDARLTEDAPGVAGADGDRLPFIPKWTSSVTIDYTRPLFGDWELSVGGGLRFNSDRYTAFTSNPAARRIEGYAAGDLYAQLADDRLSVRLFAKNVGNSKGVQTLFAAGTDAAGAPLLGVNRLQPRTVGIAANVRF